MRQAIGPGYYLTQDEVNQIYQFYGGQGEYDRAEILNYFYVNFPPRVSEDGRRNPVQCNPSKKQCTGRGYTSLDLLSNLVL